VLDRRVPSEVKEKQKQVETVRRGFGCVLFFRLAASPVRPRRSNGSFCLLLPTLSPLALLTRVAYAR